MPRGIKLNVTDDDLRAIIQNERSWRGVMRALGYATANGNTQARLRSQAQMAGISTGHFWGKSSWSAGITLTMLSACKVDQLTFDY